MKNLAAGKCVPCQGGESPLAETEIAELMVQIPQWEIIKHDKVPCLQRVYKFKNYSKAVEFVNKIATIAEEEDHHPLLILEWGKVTAQWWTHVVKGLHHNDFVMAAKTDEIYDRYHG